MSPTLESNNPLIQKESCDSLEHEVSNTVKGQTLLGILFVNVNWRRLLHNIYPVNSLDFEYSDIDETCSFCGVVEETARPTYLFFNCNKMNKFWAD